MKNDIRYAKTILLAMCVLMLASACGNIQSTSRKVRYKTNHQSAKNMAKAKDPANNEQSSVSEIENFINNIENNSKNLDKKAKQLSNRANNLKANSHIADNLNNESQVKYEARIPTIREQMQTLAKDQNNIIAEVNALQNDLNEIKLALKQIVTSQNQGTKPQVVPTNDNQFAHKGISTDISAQKGVDNSFEANDSQFETNFRSSKQNTTNRGNDTEEEYDYNYNYGDGSEDINHNVIESDEVVAKKNIAKPANKVTPKKANIATKAKKVSNNSAKPKPQTVHKTEANNFVVASKASSEPAKAKSNEESIASALSAFKSQNYQVAINELNKVMANKKDAQTQATCSYWIGESYFRMGNYSSALRFFDKTLSISGAAKKEEAKIMSGECQMRLGNTKEAKVCFKEFVSIYPNSRYLPRAKRLLQEL